jgi:hypothetical protein
MSSLSPSLAVDTQSKRAFAFLRTFIGMRLADPEAAHTSYSACMRTHISAPVSSDDLFGVLGGY